MDLRANTAVDVLIGPFVDLTNGYTAEEGLTPSVLLSKNGQALAAKNDANACMHDDAGYYNCPLDATDTNTEGQLVLAVEADADALPVRHEFNVMAEAAWDSLYVAKDDGYMDVNVKAVSEDTAAADNLEAACDGDGYDIGGVDVSELNTAVDAIGSDGTGLTEAGGDGDHLTEAGGTGNQLTAITGATLDAAYNAAKTAAQAGDEMNLTSTAKSDVNAEVVDALNVDTYAEPGQGAPVATQTIRQMLQYLYKAWRNKTTTDADSVDVYNDAGDTVDQKAAVSDDGSTFTRGEMGTGA